MNATCKAEFAGGIAPAGVLEFLFAGDKHGESTGLVLKNKVEKACGSGQKYRR
jgi:hypothetical protein